MSASFADISEHPDRLRDLLERVGVLASGDEFRARRLEGGVSSVILEVDLPAGAVCVKQSLPRLRVEKDWRVPTERVFAEIAWLQRAHAVIPDHVVRVVGVDETCRAFVMEYLPESRYRNWKTALLGGDVVPAIARQVGDLIGRMHDATAGDAEVRREFGHDATFFLVRLEPFLLEAARQHPDLAAPLVARVHATFENKRVLVHGDLSPKNILVGEQGPVLLDAECACYGDPAFDAAFLLSHLMLKAVHVPAVRGRLTALADAFLTAYLRHANWEPHAALLGRTADLIPALVLARIDGKSPVDYLTAPERVQVRSAARRQLADAAASPQETITEFARLTTGRSPAATAARETP